LLDPIRSILITQVIASQTIKEVRSKRAKDKGLNMELGNFERCFLKIKIFFMVFK